MSSRIRDDESIKVLLSRMPNNVADSFSDEQLTNLKVAIGARKWGKHPIDVRGTFIIPFYRWRIYYVMLLGKNRRELSSKERKLSILASSIVLTFTLMFVVIIGLLILYLLKSALGINLLPDISLGIWSWWKELWQTSG